LEAFLVGAPESLRYNDHQIGQGPAFHRLACERGLEGIVSKRVDSRYSIVGRRQSPNDWSVAPTGKRRLVTAHAESSR
jgi:ATP-dependent DNA ligase